MTPRRLGVASALVANHRVHGDVMVDGDAVCAVGLLPAGRRRLAVPGFVDVQVNGMAGVDFTATDLAGYETASIAMARTGVTAFLATLPTTARENYEPALDVATTAAARPLPGARCAGVHLEGPFLSPLRAGAHRVDWLQSPDVGLIETWRAAAPIVLVTLAPELEGATDVIRHLRANNVIISLGHTDATGPQAHAAFDAGASMVTHVWNAQRPVTAREPGVAGTALVRTGVAVCGICDLQHVDTDTLRLTVTAAGRRFVAVTDATALAGSDDGVYEVNGRAVVVSGRSSRLRDGTLAGSTGTMDEAVRNLVGLGVPLERAIAAATSAPANALGPHGCDLGRLEVGSRADITVLNDELEVEQVIVNGKWHDQ